MEVSQEQAPSRNSSWNMEPWRSENIKLSGFPDDYRGNDKTGQLGEGCSAPPHPCPLPGASHSASRLPLSVEQGRGICACGEGPPRQLLWVPRTTCPEEARCGVSPAYREAARPPLLPCPSCADRPTAKLSGQRLFLASLPYPPGAALLDGSPCPEAGSPPGHGWAELTQCRPCPEGTPPHRARGWAGGGSELRVGGQRGR